MKALSTSLFWLASRQDRAYVIRPPFPFVIHTARSEINVGRMAWRNSTADRATKRTSAAAVKAPNWIVAKTYNTLGKGGYSFGHKTLTIT